MRRLLSILLILSAPLVHAAEFIGTNVYIVAADQTVSEEQWVAAGLVITEGIFRNDLFASSANQLELNGTYEGNVWGAASAGASMRGVCKRNLRLAGKSIRIDGPVHGNVLAMAETIVTTTNAVISGNARLIGASIIQEGLIKGNASISAGRTLTLGGTIDGNATVLAPDIILARSARIGGNLSYTANKELFPEEETIGGSIERTAPKTEPLLTKARLLSRGLWFLAALLTGIPFISLFPMTTALAAQLVRTSPWKCLFVGFIASVALPMFGIMSISSLIGVPLGSMILGSWAILTYLSRIIMGLVLGTMILRKVGSSIGRVLLAMFIGLAIIYFSTIIPVIGMPVQLGVIWVGMGSLLLALIHKRRLIIQMPQNLKNIEQLKNEQIKPEEEQP